MKYKILIFDADDTLFDFKASEKEALKRTLISYGVDYNENHHLIIYKDINNKIWRELEEGKISQKELKVERFRRFFKTLELNLDPIEFAEGYLDNLATLSIPFPDSLGVIEELSKSFELLIVTNGLNRVQTGRVKDSILAPYFKRIVISEEAGFSKPNPHIFEYALSEENYDKKDVLMIGDSLSSDIQGGINFGIDTCLYNPRNITLIGSIKPKYQVQRLEDLKEIVF